MSSQLAAQLPFAIAIIGMFLVYGSLVRRGVIREKAILSVGAGLGLLAALLALWSAWPAFHKGEIPLPLWLFNPFAMVVCSAYCVWFSYQTQRTEDLATYLVGDTKIILRTCPPTRLPPADALLLPANTFLRLNDGTAFLYGLAAGGDMAREARKSAPVAVGKVVVTDAGKLAVARVYHAVVSGPTGAVKSDAVRKAMESAANTARKAGAESVVVPLGSLRGLPFDEAAKAILAGVLKNRKAFAEIVLVVPGGREEKLALEVAGRVIGPSVNAPVSAKSTKA